MNDYDMWWFPFDMENTANLFEDCSEIIFNKYGVYINIKGFLEFYANSELRRLIDNHHPKYSTCSNTEVIETLIKAHFNNVLPDEYISKDNQKYNYSINELYWIGMFVTYCKYKSGLSFKETFNKLNFDELRRLYPMYHEMDNKNCYERIFNSENIL